MPGDLTFASLISDVASLWILALVLFGFLLVAVFRKEIGIRLLKGGVRVKRGDTELSIDATTTVSTPLSDATEVEETATPREAVADEQENGEGSPRVAETDADEVHKVTWATVLLARDLEAAGAAFAELRSAETDEIERRRMDVVYAYFRATKFSVVSARDDLETYAKSDNDVVASQAHCSLGQLFENDGYFERALASFEQGLATAKTESLTVTAGLGVARTLHRLARDDEAVSRLSKVVEGLTDPEERQRCFDGLASLYEDRGDLLMRALALEKALEAYPDSPKRRFDTGYAYSQAGQEQMALLHYLAALRLDPNYQWAHNNVGVAYERLQMPLASVREYEEAAKLGNSLAESNLALRLINGGFGDRARQLLREAAKKDDVHPNIGTRTAELAERESAEEDRKKKAILLAERRHGFFRAYAIARFEEHGVSVPEMSGNWVMDGVDVVIAQAGAGVIGSLTINKARAELRIVLDGRAFSYKLWVEETTNFFTTPPTKEFKEQATGHGYLLSEIEAHLLDVTGDGTMRKLHRVALAQPTS